MAAWYCHGDGMQESADDSQDSAGVAEGNRQQRNTSAARWRSGRAQLVLMRSGLEGQDKEAFKALAHVSGAKVVSDWEPGVTHVICGLDAGQAARCACTRLTLKRLLLKPMSFWLLGGVFFSEAAFVHAYP